jgi:hypothetical protein
MERYSIELNGLSPLIMHQDNLAFGEKVKAWQKDPANKAQSTAGDDRTPAWIWLGYSYNDGREFGIPSDNFMTMVREGGAKVSTGKGKGTFKKQTQAGILLDQQQLTLLVNGKPVPVEPFKPLIGNNDFNQHIDMAEGHGFELLVKRAKVGQSKHVRVRPMFRQWTLVGSFTVMDPEVSGLNEHVIRTVLNQAGALCGLGDWRPSSPSSGTFGRFEPVIKRI